MTTCRGTRPCRTSRRRQRVDSALLAPAPARPKAHTRQRRRAPLGVSSPLIIRARGLHALHAGPAKCMSVSLVTIAPELVRSATALHTAELRENTYKHSGFSRSLTNAMASSSEATLTMGKIGPKISSCMAGASAVQPLRMVGSMYSVASSVAPPTTLPVIRRLRRLKWPVSNRSAECERTRRRAGPPRRTCTTGSAWSTPSHVSCLGACAARDRAAAYPC